MTATVLACLFVSGIAVALALQLPTMLQLLPDEAAFAQVGWPWPVTDAWSFAADLGQALLFGFAFAWLLRLFVRRAYGWDLRLWPAATALALGLASRPEEHAGLVILVLIVVVAKAIALRPRATSPPAQPRWLRPAIVVIAVGLLIASFTYQPAHPLIVAFADRENPLSPQELYPLKPADRRLGFTMANEGLGDVTLRSVRAIGSKTAAVDVVVAGGRPIAGVRLPHGAVLLGKVVLPHAACVQEPLIGDIPAVVVYELETRVETLGLVRTQRFDVVPPARLYCH